jgi:hypothetical protein
MSQSAAGRRVLGGDCTEGTLSGQSQSAAERRGRRHLKGYYLMVRREDL